MKSTAMRSSHDHDWQFCLDRADQRRRQVTQAALVSIQSTYPHEVPFGSGDVRAIVTAHPRAPTATGVLHELYEPLLSLVPAQRFAIGHLAQGIDGNIATDKGSSRRLSGEQNHIHLHRLRALADAVIIGAATAELDDPQLTVRLVKGPNPVRLVLDPTARLPTRLRMFQDEASRSLIICANSNLDAALARWGPSRVIAVATHSNRLDLPELYSRLQDQGLSVVLVEGGGVTVSRMIDSGCLDRVQVAVTPVLVGGARRGLQLNGPPHIDDCPRPPARLFQMGEDLLWDFDLRADPDPSDRRRTDSTLRKIF